MAKRPGTDDGMLTSPTILRDFAAGLNAVDVNMDCVDGTDEVSLEEILSLYSQPINEEQAWAVCYQCCRTLSQKHRRKSSRSAGASAAEYPRRIEGPGDVRIRRDGTVKLHFENVTGKRSVTNQVCIDTQTATAQLNEGYYPLDRQPTTMHFPPHHSQAKRIEHPYKEAILLWLSASSHVVNMFTDA